MIIVTGGAGFIGSCLVKTLNDKGIDDILIVDSLGTGLKWRNLVGKRYIDLVHKVDFLENLVDGEYGAEIEAIFHLGACTTAQENDADYLLENNYRYSCTLADYAEARNIRLLYASSAETYGAGELGFSDSVCEGLKPLTMRGYSKQMFDEWVMRNGLESKFAGIKFFSVFGPNEYHKGTVSSLIYQVYRSLTGIEKVPSSKSFSAKISSQSHNSIVRLPKSSSTKYPFPSHDYIYVRDVCDTLYELFRYGEIRGLYNLGSGVATTPESVVEAVAQAMNRSVKIEYVEISAQEATQSQFFTCADIEKLQTTRIYKPCRSLDDAIQEYVQEFLMKDEAHY